MEESDEYLYTAERDDRMRYARREDEGGSLVSDFGSQLEHLANDLIGKQVRVPASRSPATTLHNPKLLDISRSSEHGEKIIKTPHSLEVRFQLATVTLRQPIQPVNAGPQPGSPLLSVVLEEASVSIGDIIPSSQEQSLHRATRVAS